MNIRPTQPSCHATIDPNCVGDSSCAGLHAVSQNGSTSGSSKPDKNNKNVSHSQYGDSKKNARTMRASDAFQKMPLSKMVPGWKGAPSRLHPEIVPETLIGPLQNKNPYVDPFRFGVYFENDIEARVDMDGQRRINALLAYDENTQERRLEAVLDSEVLSGLKKLGVSLLGNVDEGYYFKGDTTGRMLHIPGAHIRYAAHLIRQTSHNDCKYRNFDLGRVSLVAEALHRANKKLSMSVSLNRILDRCFLFGGSPSAVTSHFDLDIRPVVAEIAQELQVPLREVAKIKKPKILLYSTIGGGGHLVHTMSIDQHLRKLGFETTIMQNDANVFDALSYLTDKQASQIDPYNRVMQRRVGLDGRALRDDEEMLAELKLYEHIADVMHALSGSKNHFDITREELQDPNYIALIDSLPHLTGVEGAAISNGLRYIRWPTDLDTWTYTLKSYDVMDANQGKLALTSGDPVANRKLNPDYRHSGDTPEREIAESYLSAGLAPDFLKDPRVFIAGYPIRSEITKLSARERNDLRSNLGLSLEDQLVVVMMGSQGKRELMDIMHELLERPPENGKGKFCVVFAVGANILIKRNLMNLASQSDNRGKMEIRMADELLSVPNQTLDATQMNVLYNTADLFLSKPGGGVTAEFLENETPILMCALNGGEGGNASYLLRSGLGVMRNPKVPLGVQIETLLKGEKPRLKPEFKLPDWRLSLETMLESFIGINLREQKRIEMRSEST